MNQKEITLIIREEFTPIRREKQGNSQFILSAFASMDLSQLKVVNIMKHPIIAGLVVLRTNQAMNTKIICTSTKKITLIWIRLQKLSQVLSKIEVSNPNVLILISASPME